MRASSLMQSFQFINIKILALTFAENLPADAQLLAAHADAVPVRLSASATAEPALPGDADRPFAQ